jgi:hypothetical protein
MAVDEKLEREPRPGGAGAAGVHRAAQDLFEAVGISAVKAGGR